MSNSINAPYYKTVYELMCEGDSKIDPKLLSTGQLIYSSPATLSFNSPGATGFGVKRAALAVPGSVELLVAPGCCGRNTKLLSQVKGYEDRFFFLMMDESDIVNGRHLSKINQAIEEILDFLEEKPSVIMICSTCVDALLGTDWDRVCRKAEKACGVNVRAAYMYALTREGRKPPMVLVRKSVYSLLKPSKRDNKTVNLMGYFTPLIDDCELYEILRSLGVRTINEISRCNSFDEYLKMSEANFNLVLDEEARYAAQDLQNRLKMPFMEIKRLYQVDKIHSQYMAMGSALGSEIDDSSYKEEVESIINRITKEFGNITVNVGHMLNANPFELSLALIKYGIKVKEIYVNITKADYAYIKYIAKLSPQTKVFTNLSPTMLYYDVSDENIDITIGMDAGYYNNKAANIAWNDAKIPFGYAGVKKLMLQIEETLRKERG